MTTGAGVRDLDAQLCAEIERLALAARSDPSLLAVPVRIVVPSGSLRVHVQSLLVRSAARAVAGVSVQTLASLARSITSEAGEAVPARGTFSIQLRRLAREEPELAEPLDAFVDAYAVVDATIDDLLDAGFEASQVEAFEACIQEVPLSHAARARVHALIRVAAHAARAVAEGAMDHGSSVIRRARETVESASTDALPTRALIVHGFSDATGVQTDLIEALVRTFDTHVLIGQPPDPACDGATSPGSAFGTRFRERIAAACSEPASIAPDASSAPRMRRIDAPDPGAEARAVAERVRALLDHGVVPERIAVVARALGDHTLALRTHFTRLGIPFSGWKAKGPANAAGRQLDVLQDLLARGPDAAAERWLEALATLDTRAAGRASPTARGFISHALRSDLRHAFHQRGIVRVVDLTDWNLRDVEPTNAALTLGALRGLGAAEPGEPARAQRRTLSGVELAAVVRAARAYCTRHADWPEVAKFSVQRAWLQSLLADDFGWNVETPGWMEIRNALFPETDAIPPEFEIDRGEFLLTLRRALKGAGRAPLGGAGGGVQILDVMEARARSFEHLFVIGMQRGAFPRVLGQDPLLSDDLRRSLRAVLPDLPVKREGADEERHLFAQLASASDDITFSLHTSDASGSSRAPSPLIERLKGGQKAPEVECVPPLFSARALVTGSAVPRPAHESALRVGLSGSRDDFERVLALAIEESSGETEHARSLAASRAAVLAELDPPAALRAAPGPYLGFVGESSDSGDPRRASLYITAVERMARCPWQAFLTRVLRAEPGPDALDVLPSASDSALIGSVVHSVLDRIFKDSLPQPAQPPVALAERPSAEISWPSAADLEDLALRCAAFEAHKQGIAMPGYDRVLALRARPYLEVARACWVREAEDGARAVAAEARSAVTVHDGAGNPREIHFKVDRVDRIGASLSFTDYKTGKPAVTVKTASKRAEKLREAVANGSTLQAVAYALSEDVGTKGRYLYLGPELDPRLRVLAADESGDLADVFQHTVSTILNAWDRGSFPPRLREVGEDEEPPACKYCDVKQACLRGDSGVRARLGNWMEVPSGDAATAAERSAREIWRLSGAGK